MKVCLGVSLRSVLFTLAALPLLFGSAMLSAADHLGPGSPAHVLLGAGANSSDLQHRSSPVIRHADIEMEAFVMAEMLDSYYGRDGQHEQWLFATQPKKNLETKLMLTWMPRKDTPEAVDNHYANRIAVTLLFNRWITERDKLPDIASNDAEEKLWAEWMTDIGMSAMVNHYLCTRNYFLPFTSELTRTHLTFSDFPHLELHPSEHKASFINKVARYSELTSLARLLKFGNCSPNAICEETGMSPLLSAFEANQINAMRFLALAGANPYLQTRHGSPMNIVARSENYELAAELRDCAARLAQAQPLTGE